MYYSFDYGNVHMIALESEAQNFSAQYDWLEQDLAQVNRTVTPWIIGFWHRPWYSSNVGSWPLRPPSLIASALRCAYRTRWPLQSTLALVT